MQHQGPPCSKCRKTDKSYLVTTVPRDKDDKVIKGYHRYRCLHCKTYFLVRA